MRLLLLAAVALLPLPAQARWLEARSAGFIVRSDGGEGSLRQSVTRLEEYDRLLRRLTGTTAPPSPRPLDVYLVRSNDRLREVRPVGGGVLGFYVARVGGTAAFAIRGDRPGMGGEEVLFHEYAHHFMARYFPAYYPTWYGEGFAEYVATARFEGDRVEVGRVNPARAITLLQGEWLPSARIMAAGTGGLGRQQTGQYYAESWLIVHYLFATHERREALTRYLADLQRAVPEPTAFRAAFGMDHAGFDAELKRYLGTRLAFSIMPRESTPVAVTTITPLPASADDLLLPFTALTLGMIDDDREAAVLATVRAAAARWPDDPFAGKVLARAEINSGDRAAGVATIDRLIARSPADAALFYLRGVADFYDGRKDATRRAERYATARPWFARAVALDPTCYTALYRLAQTAPDGDDDAALAQLLAAQALAPLVGDIAVDAATALLAHGRAAEAGRVLMPIAADPHGGHATRARALLDRARAGTPGG